MSAYRQERDAVGELAVHALDHVPYGLVLIKETLKVIVYNETAAKVFSASDGLGLTEGRLVLSELSVDDLRKPAGANLGGEDEAEAACTIVRRVARKSGKVAYQVTVRPLCKGWNENRSYHHGVWLVSIHDPAKSTEVPRSLLREYYSLTESEIEVCRVLCTRGKIDDVAVELGISRNTVKTHLTRIYSKCGVNSQSMLIMRLTLGQTLT